MFGDGGVGLVVEEKGLGGWPHEESSDSRNMARGWGR